MQRHGVRSLHNDNLIVIAFGQRKQQMVKRGVWDLLTIAHLKWVMIVTAGKSQTVKCLRDNA